MKIKKGDIVARNSYNKDIIFIVDRILNMADNTQIAILKGVTMRIEADSNIDDLEIVDKRTISKNMEDIENRINKKIKNSVRLNNIRQRVYTGRILHIDGDRRYSEKSTDYYKKLGLNAIVKNIPENRQAKVIGALLERYKPDILVVTGHDAMLKSGKNYNNIYNYRNSRHFINTVKQAREWEETGEKLVIFARSVPKFF